MSDISFIFERRQFQRILLHAAGFLMIFLAAYWLREISLRPNPILQGFLQITTGIFAFVFAAVALVRFQGTQDRISLILGSGFLLSGATLIASSILFFQLIHESQIWFLWAPVAWWISRLLLALLFAMALVVEHFRPRSRHPKMEIAGGLFAVLASTYLITATLRTGRPFAVLLLDLDGLKKINDTYGHLVGSRALCRVADILRFHCRAIDTAARYGGDEFALILPEAREEEAERVAARIRETLAADQEHPPLSASIGASVYHGEGEPAGKLLQEADQNLYVEKAKRKESAARASDSSRRRLKKT